MKEKVINSPADLPLVSVIIPAYGHADYIVQCIHSVLNQTYKKIEIIVINDGSPDNTEQVLDPLIKNESIRYFSQKNKGQGAARNRGLLESKGTLVAFLDDDDCWPPDKLAWQIETLNVHKDAAAVFGFESILGNKQAFQNSASNEVNFLNVTDFAKHHKIRSPGQTLIRKKCIQELAGFNEELSGADDWDLWIRLARKRPIIYQSRLALNYRWHDSNASHDLDKLYSASRKVACKNFGSHPFSKEYKNWLFSRWHLMTSHSNFALQLGYEALAKSQNAVAVRLFKKAFIINPIKATLVIGRMTIIPHVKTLLKHLFSIS